MQSANRGGFPAGHVWRRRICVVGNLKLGGINSSVAQGFGIMNASRFGIQAKFNAIEPKTGVRVYLLSYYAGGKAV